MGTFDISGGGVSSSGGQPIGTIANIAGAAVSMALLIGIGVWGYQTLSRDVSGVPVVRATEGPMRITPENPGGRPAEHQGLAVNNVAGQGAAEAPADRLVLATPTVGLADEDQPSALLQEIAAAANPPAPTTSLAIEPEPAPVAAAPAPQPTTPTDLQALADQIAAGATPFARAEPAQTPVVPVRTSLEGDTPAPAPRAEIVPASTPGIARSLRPRTRPEGVRTASLAPAAPAANSSLDVDPAAIPAGTRLAQLGAFDSPEVARKEWARLSGRFEEYLDGKQRVIQRAKSGGRVFYRLRAMGFTDIADARRFCSALVAQGTDCIPVETR